MYLVNRLLESAKFTESLIGAHNFSAMPTLGMGEQSAMMAQESLTWNSVKYVCPTLIHCSNFYISNRLLYYGWMVELYSREKTSFSVDLPIFIFTYFLSWATLLVGDCALTGEDGYFFGEFTTLIIGFFYSVLGFTGL